MIRGLPILAFALLLTAPAVAQPAAPAAVTTRCGGVLCDLYYSGKPVPAAGQPDIPDPTHLPCRDFLCAAFGGRTPEPAPPAMEQADTKPAPAPVKTAKHKRKARKTIASDDKPRVEAAMTDVPK